MERDFSEVLRFFGLEGASIAALDDWENATYRVEQSGRGFLLRVHGKEDFLAAFIEAELAFLDWLSEKVPFATQIPLRGPDGAATTRHSGRLVSVLTWIDGEIRGEVEWKEADLRALGRMVAQLHHATRNYPLPAHWERPTCDSAEFFGSGRLHCRVTAGWQVADARQNRLLEAARARVLSAENALGRGRDEYGPIHGDLHFHNIVQTPAGLAPIDFDDMGMGFWAFDLAVPLAKMLRLPDFEARRAALLEGYTSVRALSPLALELLPDFMLARTVVTLLWGLGASHTKSAAVQTQVRGFLGDLTDKLERQLNAL